jgi:DNA polymerase-1
VPVVKKVRELHLYDLYRAEMEQVQWMAIGTWRGVAVDLKRRDDPTLGDPEKPPSYLHTTKLRRYSKGIGPRLRQQRNEALGALRKLADDEHFNPGSIVQLRRLLFEKLKFPIVAETPTGAPSTDKEAMVLLGLHADTPEQFDTLMGLVRWRKCDKLLGTYVEGLPILGDGRVHFNWKLLPVSGRLA